MKATRRRETGLTNRASRQPNNSRVFDLGTGSETTSDPQPPTSQQSTTGDQQHQQVSPIESASQSLGTTSTGLQRRRIKWTTEMNEYVVREYIKATRRPEDRINYRQEMHKNFVAFYQNLTHLTEQNIADRRAAIYRTNLVSEERRNQIAAEIVDVEVTTMTIPIETNEPVVISEVTINEPVIENNEELVARMKQRYKELIAAYQGTDPTLRPRLPKQHNSKQLNKIVNMANKQVLSQLSNNIDTYEQLNDVIYCTAHTVIELNGGKVLDLQNQPRNFTKKEPAWLTRLDNKIEDIRRNIGIITAFKNGSQSKRMKNKVSRIKKQIQRHTRHDPPNTELNDVLDTLKQQLSVYSQRVKRYKKSHSRKVDNRNFKVNQKIFYRNISKTTQETISTLPNKQQMQDFWGGIWSTESNMNTNASWLDRIQETAHNIQAMEIDKIQIEVVQKVMKKLHNWKCPGIDGIHNFWYKKFSTLHVIICKIINDFISNAELVPEYLCEGKTFMKPKEANSTNPAKYRPITC